MLEDGVKTPGSFPKGFLLNLPVREEKSLSLSKDKGMYVEGAYDSYLFSGGKVSVLGVCEFTCRSAEGDCVCLLS